MRRRNWRVVITGLILMVLGVGFFFFMQTAASASTDPVEFMRIVGNVSGVVIGLSVAMIVFGLIGKKA